MDLTKPTLKLMEAAGYKCLNVETSDIYSKRKKDLCGFIDVLGFAPLTIGCWGSTVGCQCTSHGHRNDRYAKIISSPWFLPWLGAGNGILLVTWSTKFLTARDPVIEVLGYGDVENSKDHMLRELAKTQTYATAYNEGYADGKQVGIDETKELIRIENENRKRL